MVRGAWCVVCSRSVDGYYVVLAGCFVFGVWWWVTFKTKLDKLQTRKQAEWRVVSAKRQHHTLTLRKPGPNT